MIFLEYFIWGAWYVTLGTWLGQTLHFSGEQIALAAGTTALGAMLSPFLVGLMADELFANQHLLFALHGIGGVYYGVSLRVGGVGADETLDLYAAKDKPHLPTSLVDARALQM